MVVYEYGPRAEQNITVDTIRRIAEQATGIAPQGVTLGVDRTLIEYQTDLTPAQKASLDTAMAGTISPSTDELYNLLEIPAIVYGTVQSINIPNKRVTVQRTIRGTTYSKVCAVTQIVVDLYQAGKVSVGDTVLVAFIDGDPRKGIVFDKLVL